jgi:hypothetical protein
MARLVLPPEPLGDESLEADIKLIQCQLSKHFDVDDLDSAPRAASAVAQGLAGALSWNYRSITDNIGLTCDFADDVSQQSARAAELADELHSKAVSLADSLKVSHRAIHNLSTARLSIAQRITFAVVWISRLFNIFIPTALPRVDEENHK